MDYIVACLPPCFRECCTALPASDVCVFAQLPNDPCGRPFATGRCASTRSAAEARTTSTPPWSGSPSTRRHEQAAGRTCTWRGCLGTFVHKGRSWRFRLTCMARGAWWRGRPDRGPCRRMAGLGGCHGGGSGSVVLVAAVVRGHIAGSHSLGSAGCMCILQKPRKGVADRDAGWRRRWGLRALPGALCGRHAGLPWVRPALLCW